MAAHALSVTPETVVLSVWSSKRCAVGIFLASLVASFAATDSSSLLTAQFPHYEVTTWNTDQGLPANWVECVVQTQDGYLWLGTRSGLVRFDGFDFRHFQEGNTPAFLNYGCKALAEDTDGNLWIGTKKGLIRKGRQGFSTFTTKNGLAHDEVAALCVGRDGSVWVGTGGGVSRYARGRWSTFVNSALSHQHVFSILEDRSSRVWVGFDTGLYQLDPRTGTFSKVWSTKGELPTRDHDIVTTLLEDSAHTLWWGTRHGLYARLEGRVQAIDRNSGLDSPGNIEWLHEDRHGNLWVATVANLYRGTRGVFSNIGLKTGLAGEQIQSITEDREGNLWLGTAYSGFTRLRPQPLRTLTTRDGLAHNDVWSVFPGRDGRLWLGTSGGLSRFQDGTFRSIEEPHPEFQKSIRSVIEDANGELWFGSAYDGPYHVLRRDRHSEVSIHRMPNPETRVVYEDPEHALWIGSSYGFCRIMPGPVRFVTNVPPGSPLHVHPEIWFCQTNELIMTQDDRKVWLFQDGIWKVDDVFPTASQVISIKTFAEQVSLPWVSRVIYDPLPSYDIRAILSDQPGRVWIGTRAGLARIEKQSVTTFTTQHGLAGNQVLALHRDSRGHLWVGAQGGLSRFKDERFSPITPEKGLFDSFVNSIVEDDAGYLWMGCRRGIFRASLEELNAVADGSAQQVHCLAFNEDDGMLSREVNGGCQPSAAKAHDGTLWFPTTRGVVVIDPSRVRTNELLPLVHIESIGYVSAKGAMRKLNWHDSASGSPNGLENSASGTNLLVLPPGSGRNIEVHYTGINLTHPKRVRFKYRLDGFDRDWLDVTNRRTAYYTNLKPGRYRFRVAAANRHGIWNEAGASIAFVLQPRLFQRKSVWVLCGLGLVLIGYAVQATRARHQARALAQHHELQLERQRTRIARDLHDGLGAGVTQIELLATNSMRALPANDPLARGLAKIANTNQELRRGMADLHWSMDRKYDTLRSLVIKIRSISEEFAEAANWKMKVELPDTELERQLVPEVRCNLIMATKEAFRNIAQHAQAPSVQVRGTLSGGRFRLEIRDNGRGFDSRKGREAGNGLNNMEDRMRELGGSFTLDTEAGRGTTVVFSVSFDPKVGC